MENPFASPWLFATLLCLTSQGIAVLGPVSIASSQPAPYALSPTYLQYLSQQERKVYNAMKKYEQELEHRLALVKKLVLDINFSYANCIELIKYTYVHSSFVSIFP